MKRLIIHRWLVCLWSVLVVVPLHRATAMQGQIDATVKTGVSVSQLIWGFGFEKGGKVKIELELDKDDTPFGLNSAILGCQEDQLYDGNVSPLSQDIEYWQVLCRSQNLSTIPQCFSAPIGPNAPAVYVQTLEHEIDTQSVWGIYYLNCDEKSEQTIRGTYELVNPNGEQLSVGSIEFKQVYLYLLLAWSGLLLVWCANYFHFRGMDGNQLHRLLSVVPATAVVSNALSLVLYKRMSRLGTGQITLTLLAFVADGASRWSLTSSILLIAKGWCVTKPELAQGEWRGIYLLSTSYVFAYWSWSLMATQGSVFLLFLLLIIYVIILRVAFSSIRENVVVLSARVHVLSEMDLEYQRHPAWTQLLMFTKYRQVLSLYISVEILLSVWSMIADVQNMWIVPTCEMTWTALLTIFVGWTFRLRSFNPYNFEGETRTPLISQPPPVIIIENPGENSVTVGYGGTSGNGKDLGSAFETVKETSPSK